MTAYENIGPKRWRTRRTMNDNQERHLVLIGFMGTGKTSAGTRLARELNRSFIDIDQEIEQVSGMSVSEMFRRYGEQRFRSEETLATARLAGQKGLVISTGGGWVLKEENVALLKPVSLIIWLNASPETIYSRVTRKKSIRPLLKNIHNPEELEQMMSVRRSYYQRAADLEIDTGSCGLRQLVHDIAYYMKYGRLPENGQV